MKIIIFITFTIIHTLGAKSAKKTPTTDTRSLEQIKKDLEKHEEYLLGISKNRTNSTPLAVSDLGEKPYVLPTPKPKKKYKIIYPDVIKEWAQNIANKLEGTKKSVTRWEHLQGRFVNVKSGPRDGAAVVEKAAASFGQLLKKRAAAAEAVMRKAEHLQSKNKAPKGYQFKYSYKLDKLKPTPSKPNILDYQHVKLLKCRSQNYELLHPSSHFDAMVTLNLSSVHVATEIYDCNPEVLRDMYWSETLDSVFRQNYRQDASIGFQYFCSAKGFLRHYPAASWDSMFKLDMPLDQEDDEYQDISATGVYDCRLRPWYVSAGGAPRDILIMLDASGSMYNSSNKVIAEQYILALLSALTDDDQINVLRFNVSIAPIMPCFKDMLISANHINTAAIMATMKYLEFHNETNMKLVLTHAVDQLQTIKNVTGRRKPCQQAIVLITDTLNENMTSLMKELDPDGDIRLFIIWLHDPYGVRDNTRAFSTQLSCTRDGYFAELVTHADVTEQVLRLLRVLERPLVLQRKQRLTVFSDVYAHVEDPRRMEVKWIQKENQEQKDRYLALRRDKKKLLDPAQLMKDYMHSVKLDEHGQYYEGVDVNYRLQISVSVPVFESTTLENVTITLEEAKLRLATRTYPVNRLLGVAGVDIPIDHLKLVLPFYQVGPGGFLFIVDHRGNIVLHNNLKPTFDGDILKPGYRTVDFLDLEQAAGIHKPREYPAEWVQLRNNTIIVHPKGTETLSGKYIFEGGMRAILEKREYHWRRVHDHYTVVLVVPHRSTRFAVPTATKFTQKASNEASTLLTDPDFVVQPDWLYCKYVHKTFDTPELELREFLERRAFEPNFSMKKLEYSFSPMHEGDFGKAYQCDEELMARLCADTAATDLWAARQEKPGSNCSACYFGSVTAFIALESGLTRWQKHHVTGAEDPPGGKWWPRGPAEPWYARAAAAPNTLVVHAPVAPSRLRRNTVTDADPPPKHHVTGAEEPPVGTWWPRGPAEPWYARAAAAPITLVVHAPVAPSQLRRNTVTDADPPPLGERYRWLTAAQALKIENGAMVGVAGFHFHPQYMEDVLKEFTDFPFPPDEEDLYTTCKVEYWFCLLVDDGGWIVATGTGLDTPELNDPELPRLHLATLYPVAMRHLLDAGVFDLNWIHDYQAVCFPPAEEELDNAGPIMPSILRSVWHAVRAIVHETSEALIVIAMSSYGRLVSSETTLEKEKRRHATRRSYEREKFDRLFDERVLVNRTKIAACDRSRPLYVFHRERAAVAFKRSMDERNCSWPVAGALVPGTNLLLLAVFQPCMSGSVSLPDPLINTQIKMGVDGPKTAPSAALLACRRNAAPLPTREPRTTCFNHCYSEEEGYRQCGPWQPDADQPEEVEVGDEEDGSSITYVSKLLMALVVSWWIIV